MLGQVQCPRETGLQIKKGTAHGMSYLVQSPSGVPEEGDAMSLSDTDGHSSEAGS